MTRWEFLQDLIDWRGYGRYLEVGTAGGKTFNRLTCDYKAGVDVRGDVATFRGTSDEFFAQNAERFDLVFVDGWHNADQALRDVDNALAVLEPGGLVVMHDCNPVLERRVSRTPTLSGGWNGNVWEAFVALRQRPSLDCACGDFDQGCGVVVPRPNTDPLEIRTAHLTWRLLELHRQRWLRLMDDETLLDWIGG